MGSQPGWGALPRLDPLPGGLHLMQPSTQCGAAKLRKKAGRQAHVCRPSCGAEPHQCGPTPSASPIKQPSTAPAARSRLSATEVQASAPAPVLAAVAANSGPAVAMTVQRRLQ